MPKKEPKQTNGQTKRRKRWIWALVIGVLLFLGIMTLLMKPGVSSTDSSPAPSEVFTRYLEETVAEQPEEFTTVGSEAEAAIIERVKYTVLEQADTQVTLEIAAPDMTAILDEAVQSDGTAQGILDALRSDNYPTKTTTLTVELDENGKMIESREFVDAMYGGLLTYLDRFVLEMEELG